MITRTRRIYVPNVKKPEVDISLTQKETNLIENESTLITYRSKEKNCFVTIDCQNYKETRHTAVHFVPYLKDPLMLLMVGPMLCLWKRHFRNCLINLPTIFVIFAHHTKRNISIPKYLYSVNNKICYYTIPAMNM
jgi:hypothetical protein